VLEDHEINLAQAKDKNANGIDEIVYVLWNIIALCEGNNICEG
jgi:hypothetical protein